MEEAIRSSQGRRATLRRRCVGLMTGVSVPVSRMISRMRHPGNCPTARPTPCMRLCGISTDLAELRSKLDKV